MEGLLNKKNNRREAFSLLIDYCWREYMMFCSYFVFNKSGVEKKRGKIEGWRGAFSKNTKGIRIVDIGNTYTGSTVVNGCLRFPYPVVGKRSIIDFASTTGTACLLTIIHKKFFACLTTWNKRVKNGIKNNLTNWQSYSILFT